MQGHRGTVCDASFGLSEYFDYFELGVAGGSAEGFTRSVVTADCRPRPRHVWTDVDCTVDRVDAS